MVESNRCKAQADNLHRDNLMLHLFHSAMIYDLVYPEKKKACTGGGHAHTDAYRRRGIPLACMATRNTQQKGEGEKKMKKEGLPDDSLNPTVYY